jgi:hypothetical protein
MHQTCQRPTHHDDFVRSLRSEGAATVLFLYLASQPDSAIFKRRLVGQRTKHEKRDLVDKSLTLPNITIQFAIREVVKSVERHRSAPKPETKFRDTAHIDHALLPPQEPRMFESFCEAAAEAAVSRLYGGIHYRFDNDGGLASGECIGLAIQKRVSFKIGYHKRNATRQEGK